MTASMADGAGSTVVGRSVENADADGNEGGPGGAAPPPTTPRAPATPMAPTPAGAGGAAGSSAKVQAHLPTMQTFAKLPHAGYANRRSNQTRGRGRGRDRVRIELPMHAIASNLAVRYRLFGRTSPER